MDHADGSLMLEGGVLHKFYPVEGMAVQGMSPGIMVQFMGRGAIPRKRHADLHGMVMMGHQVVSQEY